MSLAQTWVIKYLLLNRKQRFLQRSKNPNTSSKIRLQAQVLTRYQVRFLKKLIGWIKTSFN